MKHTSPLQQLHWLLTSAQSGHTSTHTCVLKATHKDYTSLDLDDPCSSEVSSDRGDSSCCGVKMSISHSDIFSSRDQLLSDLDDAYICNGSGGSVRKEYSFPALHTETSDHNVFSPAFKLTHAPGKDSSPFINSVDTINFPVNASKEPLKARTDSINIINHLDETMQTKSELGHTYKRTENMDNGAAAMITNHEVNLAENGPVRLTKHSTQGGIVGNTESSSNSLITGCSMFINDRTLDEHIRKLGMESGIEESSRLCRMKFGAMVVAGADGGVNEMLSNIPPVFCDRDTLEWKIISNSADTQTCSAKSANMTQLASKELKLKSQLPATSSTSTRSRRHRQIEIEQVHQVYQQIAPHCDHVRQKAWPRVKRFLKELEAGSIVADVGCGNGRYLKINSSIFKVGCDPCPPFLDQARSQGHEVMIADNIALPYRDATFDAVISIGVIHHFASLDRRITAISELSRILSRGGRLMIYVWAFEQIHRKFESQDVLIPWVKPEVKDQTRRNTLSCSSEPDSLSLNSASGPACTGVTVIPTSRRRRRHERNKSNNAVGDRCRSKSLGDGDSAMDDRSSRSVSQRFGVFDRRDNTKREASVTRQDSIESENAFSDDTSNYNCQVGNESDVKAISKWPGQLVSECRKLGKFLRSLSNRSDSQSNGDADHVSDFGEKVTDANDDFLLECNTNPNVGISTEASKDTCDKISNRRLINQCCHAEIGTTVPLSKTERHATIKDGYILRGVSNPSISGDYSSFSSCDPINTTASEYSCDMYDNNTTTTSIFSTTYRNVCSTEYKTATEMTTQNSGINTPSSFTPSALTCHSLPARDSDDDNSVQRDEAGANPTCIQFPMPVAICNNSYERYGEPSEIQVASNLNSYNLPGCSSRIDLEPSESWMTVSASMSSTSRDSVSAQSDATVIDIFLDSTIYSHPLNDTDALRSPGTQKTTFSYKADDNTPLGNPLENTSCFAHEITNDITFEQDPKNCLPKSQQFLDTINSDSDNTIHGYFRNEGNNLVTSRSNTSTEVNYEVSDLTDTTDCLDGDSVFILDQEKSVHHYRSHCQSTITNSGIHPMKDSSNICRGASSGHEAEIHLDKDGGSTNDHMTRKYLQQPLDSESTNQKIVPFRATFKTVFHKLADYFHLQTKNESKPFGCYHNGKRFASNFLMESDSSENETPVTSFSTHSSCYPGIFAVSKDSESSEKGDMVPEQNKNTPENNVDEDAFEIINETQASDILGDGKSHNMFSALRINVLRSKQNVGQDFVNDVSENAAEDVKDTPKSSFSDPYTFKVKNLSLAPVKKDSIFQLLSEKWSGLFSKENAGGPKQACLRYSAVSSLSSSDDEEETLKISLLDNETPDMFENKPPNNVLIERPNYLDFTKKRTRRKGRRPAPRRESRENRTQSNKDSAVEFKGRTVQNDGQLSLSDAMTLLGDGAPEESVIQKLDDSAKTIFAEMKRMNFAIRQFPMSSVESENNEDGAEENAGSLTEADVTDPTEDVAQTKPQTLKMRRDKRIFASHRRFSDSITSQSVKPRQRRGTLLRQREISDTDSNERVYPLRRKYLSTDHFGSIDSFGLRRYKCDSQLVCSHSHAIKPDMFTPLDPSSESQQASVDLQNRSNNAQMSDEHSVNNDALVCDKQRTPFGVNALGKSIKEHENDCTIIENDAFLLRDSQKNHNEDARSESTENLKISQSHFEKDNTGVDGIASPITTCNKSASKVSLSYQCKYSSTKQNFKGRKQDTDQFNLMGSKTDNSLSRYYHVFKKGELDQLLTCHVPSLKIVETFYDHANWCIIAEKL